MSLQKIRLAFSRQTRDVEITHSFKTLKSKTAQIFGKRKYSYLYLDSQGCFLQINSDQTLLQSWQLMTQLKQLTLVIILERRQIFSSMIEPFAFQQQKKDRLQEKPQESLMRSVIKKYVPDEKEIISQIRSDLEESHIQGGTPSEKFSAVIIEYPPEKSTYMLPEVVEYCNWVVKNTGYSDWDQVTLVKTEGNLNFINTHIKKTILPGQQEHASVIFVSPCEDGKFFGVLRLHQPDGVSFGPEFRVNIEVPLNHIQALREISFEDQPIIQALNKHSNNLEAAAEELSNQL